MTEFPYKPGDKIREPRWNPRSYVHIVALGDDTFIGRMQTGECLYRKDGDWERYVEPEPCKQFTIDTERRIPRLGDDLVLLHGGTPRLGHVGGGAMIYVGPHWVVTKITEHYDGPAVTIWHGTGGVGSGPGVTIT